MQKGGKVTKRKKPISKTTKKKVVNRKPTRIPKPNVRRALIAAKILTPQGRQDLLNMLKDVTPKYRKEIGEALNKAKAQGKNLPYITSSGVSVSRGCKVDGDGTVKKVSEVISPMTGSTVVRNKPPVQHRPTKEEVEEANQKEAVRQIGRRDTINKLGDISCEARKMGTEYSHAMFDLGLKRALGDPKLNRQISELEEEQTTRNRDVLENPVYVKAQKKLIDKIGRKGVKLKKKLYKKAKKRFGKKIAKVIFANAYNDVRYVLTLWNTPMPVNKKLNKKYAERKRLFEKIKEEMGTIECPRVSPEDLSIADHSAYGTRRKKKVVLPGDCFTGPYPEPSTQVLKKQDDYLLNLAQRMP